ncbi:helix-turn-helix domain-containing protein [Flavobacterium sp. F52]|uniref:helix-turn-helix domain-containing protein n=1 Tax=Flavobacterium sp. F52 TaxID=1202532 RepID=UPI000272D87A|nr:helix-turn-helix domain-containing protein [Flavobacterium sp. F52]EJG02194.1 AraC family transcriptional regulator [Flavobacterium sp. F52]
MQIKIDTIEARQKDKLNSCANYQILLLREGSSYEIDFRKFQSAAYSILFLTPYQHVAWHENTPQKMMRLQFHGDFYCIEYHKKEVACNGLLFNNIYLHPYVEMSHAAFTEIEEISNKISSELKGMNSDFSESVIKAYLQVILALSSKEKKQQISSQSQGTSRMDEGLNFQQLLEENFLAERSVQFYAEKLNLTAENFSKKIKSHLGKPPSGFIYDRIVLESKKLLHLTHMSIKEISADLHFQDEHYFSRFFKKHVGISPSDYRNTTGISIAAK